MDCTEQLKMCLVEAGFPEVAEMVSSALVNSPAKIGPAVGSELVSFPLTSMVIWESRVKPLDFTFEQTAAVDKALELIRCSST